MVEFFAAKPFPVPHSHLLAGEPLGGVVRVAEHEETLQMQLQILPAITGGLHAHGNQRCIVLRVEVELDADFCQ